MRAKLTDGSMTRDFHPTAAKTGSLYEYVQLDLADLQVFADNPVLLLELMTRFPPPYRDVLDAES